MTHTPHVYEGVGCSCLQGTVRFIGNGFGSRMNETGFRSNPYLEIWQFNDTG